MKKLLTLVLIISFFSAPAQTPAQEYYALLVGGKAPYKAIDPDAVSYIGRVAAAGYGMTDAEMGAVDTFYMALKANGLWSKIYDGGFLMVGGAVPNAHLITLKNIASPDFNGGVPVVSSSGVGPLNGTTNYIQTYITPSVSLIPNNTHMALYSQTAGAGSGSDYDMSSANGVSQEMGLILRRSNNAMYSIQYNETASQGMLTATTSTDGSGIWISSRPAANNHFLMQNSAIKLSQTTSGGALPNNFIAIGVQGYDYTVGYTKRKYSYWSVGQGFTDAEAQTYSTLINNLHKSLNINTY